METERVKNFVNDAHCALNVKLKGSVLLRLIFFRQVDRIVAAFLKSFDSDVVVPSVKEFVERIDFGTDVNHFVDPELRAALITWVHSSFRASDGIKNSITKRITQAEFFKEVNGVWKKVIVMDTPGFADDSPMCIFVYLI